MLRSDIRLTPSEIALRAVSSGEYNITLRHRRKISRLPSGKHFTSSEARYFTFGLVIMIGSNYAPEIIRMNKTVAFRVNQGTVP